MKATANKSESTEYFEVEYQNEFLLIKCLVTLESWNIKELKLLMSEAIVFQPLQGLILDFQSQPVDSESFQVVVQAAQTLKSVNKKMIVLNTTSEFSKAVVANGLTGMFQMDGGGETVASKEPSESKPQTFPSNTRILIVDDIQSVRALLRAFLEELGYEDIQEAQSGEEAIGLIESSAKGGKPVQIVISDWYMPGMTGLQLHRRIRDNQSYGATVKFILLTVETEKHNVLKAFQEGVKYYLIKPFRLETISEKFREVWGKSQASAPAPAAEPSQAA
jgi:two-component system chemotaxis response regulator CheY